MRMSSPPAVKFVVRVQRTRVRTSPSPLVPLT